MLRSEIVTGYKALHIIILGDCTKGYGLGQLLAQSHAMSILVVTPIHAHFLQTSFCDAFCITVLRWLLGMLSLASEYECALWSTLYTTYTYLLLGFLLGPLSRFFFPFWSRMTGPVLRLPPHRTQTLLLRASRTRFSLPFQVA